MKRRQFLGMAAAGAAGFVLPATARDNEFLALRTLGNPHLLEVLRDERMVRDLGRRYREMIPAEDNARVLGRAILAESHVAPFAPLPAQLKEQVARDFSGGRTVTLNGWILAVTEARQCALYSLLPA